MIGAGAAALALILWSAHWLDGWENTTWGWRVSTLAGPGEHTDDIVLILLDQPSLDWGELENGLTWPWPREVYVPIIDFCTRAGARSVAFDVLFTEASGFGVLDDEALGQAIARNGRFVGARFLSVQAQGEQAGRLDEPIGEVAENARLLANVSEVPDSDGVFRRASLLRPGEQVPVPSLGVGSWLVGEGQALEALPVDGGPVVLRFRGPASVYPTYSAASIVQSELRLLEGAQPTVDPDALRNKHVLFGFSAPGLMDLRPTPLSSVSPGVVIHATVLDNLLADDFIQTMPGWAVLLGTLILALLAGALAVLARDTRTTVAVAVLVLLVPLAVGFVAYGVGWWAPIIPGVLAAGLALFGGIVRNYAVEGSQKRFIKQAFRHYLSPAVIDRIMADPGALKLGGERRELTIMFSDLAGFTSLSEGLEPEELTALLNDYLTDMTDIILEEGGTLDKYEGDAIMAFWNAPIGQPDHAARACRAAVRCQRQLAARRPEFKERCGKEMHARIGLHTGLVVVGNMGSRQRFDYTVLGDAANLASRLEGANKAFGSDIMISAVTRDQAEGFLCRPLGPLQVVGRKAPVEVFQLGGLPGESAPDGWTRFALALDAWRKGREVEAAQVLAELEGDPVAATVGAMCADPGAWTTEPTRMWVMTRK
jgi:adenylate cyclase